jgi:signal transduction histidine kinase
MPSLNKIAIVDDELSMRKHLQLMLGDLGHELVLLESGTALLEQIETVQPDLIILDVVMPEMDGFEVCRRLKSGKWQHIPIILTTVLDAKKVLTKGIDAGADDYLQKPVNKLEVLARVRSMLRIKRQYDELQATLHLREELSNMIVHDMSSPIVSVQLHTALLEEQLIDPKQREHLEMIRQAAERLDSFVNDMLMTAKMEQSKLRLHLSPVDLSRLVLDAEKHFSIIAQSRGLQLVLRLPDTPVEMSLDDNLFRRVIANLLANALQYSPGGTTVTLALERFEEMDGTPHIRIKVTDEGPGIPAADRKRIFDKFEVVEVRKKGIRQVGLGLTFCKMAVEAHAGRIYVEPNKPTGSVFIVEI